MPLGTVSKLPLLDRITEEPLKTLKRKASVEELRPLKKRFSPTASSNYSLSGRQQRTTSTTSSRLDPNALATPSPTCPGMALSLGEEQSTTPTVMPERASSLSCTGRTSPAQSSSCGQHKMPPKESLRPNGNGFLKESRLISTLSCLQLSALRSMKIGRRALEEHNSLLVRQNQKERCAHTETGFRLGDAPPEPSPSPSLTETTSSRTTSFISKPNLTRNKSAPTKGSSSTILLSGTTSAEDKQPYSPSAIASPTSIRPSSSLMGLNSELTRLHDAEEGVLLLHGDKKPVTSSILSLDVPIPPASTATVAGSVERKDTDSTPALKSVCSEEDVQPKYLRYNLWGADQTLPFTLAEWSETASPLPRPPTAELELSLVNHTLLNHAHLFSVSTPIHVNKLEENLVTHPNQDFVRSVLTGLREGFWPWACTTNPDFPSQYHQKPAGTYTDDHRAFFRSQLQHEQIRGRYSSSAGRDLLPGMYCMPIYAVPKPNSTDLRLVNDYSAGPYSLNAMVDHDRVTGYPLDNLHQLGQMLLELRHVSQERELTMWKSDISEAYRMCPVHPAWQLKQAVCIDGDFYID